MLVGKVVGSVVSTRKCDNLVGNKFMMIELPESMQTVPEHRQGERKQRLVAIDQIGAGIGDYVLVAQGSAARIGCGMEHAPVDAAIVGIIDDASGLE